MKAHIETTGGGASEIRLEIESVLSEIDDAKQALQEVQLTGASEDAYGKNRLNYTDQWLEREKNLEELLKQYMQVVEKNLADTVANVKTLKEQDEAIKRT
ncbi:MULTISPECIES: YwqI/YxiC family protein [Virgibacillus]|uniref:YwqI/YxiC family protein n=1 Tax=Virgibacillus TaxID=84406 RepID=UPI0004D18025|nr:MULTISPECIES: YwqI/YxiC family protein [Virgibacillus]AIF42594.1 hypothetical protein X953_04440 [Virgibacillus sp. SK37]MCJ0932402.1 YwqI/YxiC family protein [Virgibacillus halodenitrificans]MEC2158063.1 YwqI/YxiC family protein [Virgibacillus halodenitrificans]